MKPFTFSFLVVAFLMMSFAVFAQDDVYYSPSNDKARNSRNNSYEDQFNTRHSGSNSGNQNTNSGTSDPYRYDEVDQRNTSNGQYNDGYATNARFQEDNDFYYTSQLRRFYTPTFNTGFWDPWYTDMYYYTRDPWMWGNSIYVNVIPSFHWWRPRVVVMYDPWFAWGGNRWGGGWNSWNSPWYGNGWNNCGWNSWGMTYGWNNWGWNNWGFNNHWGGNNWAYNNGYWNGYNQGYYDGAWNSGWNGGNGGRNYNMSGPRFQSTSTNTNTGSNSGTGKFGKTDETAIPREGIMKPRTEPNNNRPIGGDISGGKVTPTTPSEKFDGRKAPIEGWKEAPATTPREERFSDPSRVPQRVTPTERVPSREVPRGDQFNDPQRFPQRGTPTERMPAPNEQPSRFDNTPAERPSNNPRIDRMREDLNRDMQPVERPNRSQQPQRNIDVPQQREIQRPAPQREMNQPQQREMQQRPAPQREMSQPQQREMQQRPAPQREMSQPQRMERQMPQRNIETPQRQFQQPQQAPRMERMAPQQSTPNRSMSPGRRP